MIQQLKAEFGLCRKNRANFILGACGTFVFCLLMLFSGVGGVKYTASVSLFGLITVWFFLIPWFLSPSSYFLNRKKIVVSSEHMALILGVCKRNFVKTRVLICIAHCVLTASVITLMQIPAYLISGEKYSFLVFGTALVTTLGLSVLSMVILFLCPSHRLALGIPFWCGYCGGVAGGLLGHMQEFTEAKEVFSMFAAVAVVGVIAFALAVVFRYVKTVCEERRGLPKKGSSGKE